MPTPDRLAYSMLANMNLNLLRIIKLLEKMQEDRVDVTTQESHS